MRLLILPAIDVCDYADKFVDLDVVGPSLHVELQVLALVAEELPLVYDDSYLLREPVGNRPQLLCFSAVYSSVNHEYRRNALYSLPGGELLIPLASIAPAASLVLSFHTRFEDLRECWAGCAHVLDRVLHKLA